MDLALSFEFPNLRARLRIPSINDAVLRARDDFVARKGCRSINRPLSGRHPDRLPCRQVQAMKGALLAAHIHFPRPNHWRGDQHLPTLHFFQ